MAIIGISGLVFGMGHLWAAGSSVGSFLLVIGGSMLVTSAGCALTRENNTDPELLRRLLWAGILGGTLYLLGTAATMLL